MYEVQEGVQDQTWKSLRIALFVLWVDLLQVVRLRRLGTVLRSRSIGKTRIFGVRYVGSSPASSTNWV